MNDGKNNSFGARVKEEIEEDWSNSEMIHENIAIDDKKVEFKQEVDCYVESDGGRSLDATKQECKEEADWNIVKDEYLPDYAENVELLSNLEMNFYVVQGRQKLFQCPECPVKVKYEANLNRHISFMHPKNKPVGITPRRTASNSLQMVCKNKSLLLTKGISENHELVRNESKHNTELLKKKKYRCSHCIFNCNYKHELIYHVYQFHFDSNDLLNEYSVCSRCNRLLHKSVNKKNHKVYCTIEKKVQCDYCSYRSKTKYYIKQHIFKKHFIDGVFQNEPLKQFTLPACSRCGKRYARSSLMSNHIAFCGKTLPFQCKTCTYASDNKINFVIHILTHLKRRNLCQDLHY